jgi:uncharacterized membrane protein
MAANRTLTRLLAGIALLVGAVTGFGFVEGLWQMTHTGIYTGWNRPMRGADYWLMAFVLSVSIGALGAALVALRAPDEETPPRAVDSPSPRS